MTSFFLKVIRVLSPLKVLKKYPHFVTKNRRRSVAGDLSFNSLKLASQGPNYTSALGPTNTQEDCVKEGPEGRKLESLNMPNYTGDY